jgi:trigger factor
MEKEILDGISIEKKAGSQVEIKGELPYALLEKHRATALSAIGRDIEVDGFRKGHVPESVLVKRVGEMAIISEMAERALAQAYPAIVAHHTLDVIGYPQISITKLAKDNPLGFTITVSVVPDIKLPDYAKIAQELNKKKESEEVTEEEVTKQIEDILRQKAAYERLQKKAGSHADHVHGENCDHDHEHEAEEEPLEDIKDLPIPEFTDEFVQTLGKPGQFTSVEDFKAKIREHLSVEKARHVASEHRAKITDSIIEKSEMELPQILVDAEIKQMLAQMEEDLTRAQLKMDDYLAHIKKTKEELVKEWVPAAEKRAKLQLVLNEIAKKASITPDPARLDAEVDQILSQYKDADEKRVRVYVTSVLTNDAVMQMLETQ